MNTVERCKAFVQSVRQLPNRENGLYLVYKVIQRLGQHWRRITGNNLCKLILDGRPFVDGQMVDGAVK